MIGGTGPYAKATGTGTMQGYRKAAAHFGLPYDTVREWGREAKKAPASPARARETTATSPPVGLPTRRAWLERRLVALDDLLLSVNDPTAAEKLLRESRLTRGEYDKLAAVEDGEDEDDEVDPRTATEEEIVTARLGKLRRGLDRAEKTGNVAAIAALSRQIAIAEDRIVQLRPPASRGLEDVTEEQFQHELRSAAAEMPEAHLRAFVDVYLERHRLILTPDASQIRKIRDERDEGEQADGEESAPHGRVAHFIESRISVPQRTARLAPTPAIQPVSASVTQMVENQREYFIALRRRLMPSRCTRPIVPA